MTTKTPLPLQKKKVARVSKKNGMVKIAGKRLDVGWKWKAQKLYPDKQNKPWTVDAYMAAYLGCSDRSEHFKLLFSALVIELYNHAEPYLAAKTYVLQGTDLSKVGTYDDIQKEYLLSNPSNGNGREKRRKLVRGLGKSLLVGYARLEHLTSPTRWQAHGFSRQDYPFKYYAIPAKAIPSWIMSKAEDAEELLPEKDFPCQWQKFWGTKTRRESLEAHLNETLPELKISPSKEEFLLTHDPRSFSLGEQWFDSLREEIELPKILMDVAHIDLLVEGEKNVHVYGGPDAMG
ncbi:uncharacterized protein PAC_07430 [Phialocephala subalpina]|uniref:Uncharacterized protein n=1 Tax=Phialocephala subalpina TaxID=576137 RepID=A0A1L7WXP1_9HELO|nr:uncharacterized protein PAC_07430 [Phialocephala subalpina]